MNLQNIPRGLTDIKQGFIPKLDNFLFFDYSNIELRILGYYLATTLGDFSVADEFITGEDLHLNTASGIFNKPTTQISEEERQRAKTLNFSIVYGGGIPTIIRQGIASDYQEAKRIKSAFHATRPGISLLVKKIIERYDEVGFIQTPWGSRLHPMDDHKALNVLIQGCAADLMRHGIREVSRYLRTNLFKSHIVNVVHDEIILDVHEPELLQLVKDVPSLMRYKTIDDIVPIKCSTEISYGSWADKEHYIVNHV